MKTYRLVAIWLTVFGLLVGGLMLAHHYAPAGARRHGVLRRRVLMPRRLCAHADQDGRGAHWLQPGERCARMTRCRYLRRNDQQCTAEAVDETGEVLLCTKHLGRALELLKRYGALTKENA
jgi:hypothetical protein